MDFNKGLGISAVKEITKQMATSTLDGPVVTLTLTVAQVGSLSKNVGILHGTGALRDRGTLEGPTSTTTA